VLSTRPGSRATSWHQVVFPAPQPPGRHRIDVCIEASTDDRRRIDVELGAPVERTFSV
jgi:hypothetical protein